MSQLIIKSGVDLSMIDPRIWEAIPKIVAVYARYGADCIITSGRDGRHSARSWHYFGRALDFRTRHLPSEGAKSKVAAEVKEAVGDAFDVVLERTHLHVEYDPR